MDLKSFLENPWTSGIGGGLISGFIVFYVTRWFLQRKDKNGYITSVNSANKQVINLLKAYVVDKGLPDYQIVNSIISATAREFSVKREEMYDVIVICEELIKEIIGNVYVSSDQKQKYLEDLRLYMEQVENHNYHVDNCYLEKVLNQSSYRTNYQNISFILGTVSAILAFLIPFLPRLPNFFKDSSNFTIMLIMMGSILISFYSTFILIKFRKKLLDKRKE